MTDDQLKELLWKRISLWQRVLGIDSKWHFTVEVCDHPNGDQSMNAGIYMDSVYFNAKIEFSRLDSENQFDESVLHEMLHVALAPLRLGLDHIIQMLPDDKQREIAEQLADSAMEQTIQGLCRGSLLDDYKEELV